MGRTVNLKCCIPSLIWRTIEEAHLGFSIFGKDNAMSI